ncbi:unnamed protein product [Leuciscus chuanchicus]
MELFIFIAFQLLMEVQSYKSPAVKVSPDVLSESSSVKMICETPADVTVKQCHFYINREQKNIKVSPSCELDLTGAEVLRWADVKSPASVDIYCFYLITEYRIDKPSSHSPAVTVTVLGSLQKPFISVSDNDVQINIVCEISPSVRADLTCSLYTEDVLLHRNVSQIQKSQFGEHPFCAFYPSYSELFTRSVNSRHLSCDYYINTEPEIRSPRSDTHTITGLPQAKLTASASVIKETDTVQLSCENTEDLKMEMCVFNINGRESKSVQSSSCQLSLTGSQISIGSEGQSSSVRITCFYTVKSQVLVPSPLSDPVTITIQTRSAHSSETATLPSATIIPTPKTSVSGKTGLDHIKTSLPLTFDQHQFKKLFEVITSQYDHYLSRSANVSFGKFSWLLVVLVFTGIGLFLSGLMGFICLCHFDSSDDVLTEVIYNSCQVETTSLLCSSKHG